MSFCVIAPLHIFWLWRMYMMKYLYLNLEFNSRAVSIHEPKKQMWFHFTRFITFYALSVTWCTVLQRRIFVAIKLCALERNFEQCFRRHAEFRLSHDREHMDFILLDRKHREINKFNMLRFIPLYIQLLYSGGEWSL